MTLKYYTEGVPIEIEATPGSVGVLEPTEPKPVQKPLGAIAESLRQPTESRPLREISRGRKNAGPRVMKWRSTERAKETVEPSNVVPDG